MNSYRRGYNTIHVSKRLIENWRKELDSNIFTGAVLMDLSKAFELYDLLIAKLHAHGLGFDTVTFLFTYSKERK